jgi:iron complex outermembrane receptor protein
VKLTRIVQSLALIGLSSYAIAQNAPAPAADPQRLEKVTVTGSSIKRLADQRALPIETFTRSEIEQLGVTSAEQLVNLLSSNVAGANNPVSSNTVFGADADRLTGGGDFANLRGLGPTGTLVLLNGRRVSTHGMSGGSVDLNAIPLEAVERVETLKDGASAIYGTDAIGGVINFITRTNYQGFSLRASYSSPEEKGGGQRARISATAGVGSLAQDGYNLMASLTIDDNKILRGIDRSWATGFQPERGLSPESTSAAHANIVGSTGTALAPTGSVVGTTDPTRYTNLNLLAINGTCDELPYTVPLAPNVTLWDKFGYTNANSRYRCSRDYGRMFMLAAPREATNLLVKGTMDIKGHRASIEVVASRTEVDGEYAPFQFTTNAGAAATTATSTAPAFPAQPSTHYPVNGPHYLNLRTLAGAAQFDPTLPIAYRLNMVDWGFRLNTNRSDNLRVQASLDGEIWGLDYSIGAGYGKAEASTLLKQGYADPRKLVTLLASGQYNPFLRAGQTQSASTMAAIEDMQVRGRVFGGETSVKQADATLSGNLGTFKFLGDVDFAVGLNARQESYTFSGTQNFQCVSFITAATLRANSVSPVLGCPGNASSPKLSRDIGAVFGEVVIRPTKSLELTLQARHDEYQSIGGTTNPKIGIKFQPTDSLLLRASANTGFRAPTPQQIKLGQVELALTGSFRDPVLCADTANPIDATQCNRSGLPYRTGGNPDLTPEESKQATAGVVFAPTRNTQVFADYWTVELNDRIRTLSVTNMIANYPLFVDNFIRDPATNVVSYIQAGWVNAAESKTKGFDFGMQHRFDALGGRVSTSFGGTRMLSNKERALKTVPLTEFVGKWNTTSLYLKWRLNASVGFKSGPWNTTLSAAYRDSYEDEDRSVYTVNEPTKRTIESYTTFNLVSTYTGFKGIALTASVLNLFDKQPPFTWHNVDNVVGAGWDPRVADPRGRVLSVSASYKF